ncbi:MAG: HDIG domain-containing metalloprotein [Patescibacteria group bacterium]
MKQLQLQKKFPFIAKLQKKFPQAEIFLVGGIVRDTILKRATKDYDFVIRNVPTKKLQAFLAKEGRVDLVGKNFGVFKFIPHSLKFTVQSSQSIEPIDIALPRTEHALLTGGYRDFDVQSDPYLRISKDLARRDFTINAMAYDIFNKKLIDEFDGEKDIKNKIIRTVGRPSERFKEDYSRMLRALRFACQLGFIIEKQTFSALKKLALHINDKKGGEYIVPRETISRELVKAFIADPARAFDLFDQSGLTKRLLPELLMMKKCPQPRNFHSEGDVWKHTRIALLNLATKKFRKKFSDIPLSGELVLGLLFHDLGKPYTIKRADRLRFNNHDSVGAAKARAIMERLKVSSAGVDIEKVVWLISRHMLAVHTKHSPMKRVTLEKYFFNEQHPGRDLLRLMYADVMASIPLAGQPDFTDYNSLEKQYLSLKKTARTRATLPPALIDGHDIMRLMKIAPGRLVGDLKDLVREEQLKGKLKNKTEAIAFLKNAKKDR